MKTLTVTEVSRSFSDFVNRVHYRGESALLTKGGRPMVKVIPAREAKTAGELAELWAGLPHLGAEEAEALGRDLENARASLPAAVSKWD